jgi:photosystem II stability/assembly factor-like uncharacterized protein
MFPDDNNGFACGDNSVILKTTDAGITWTQLNVGSFIYFTSAFFTSPSTGFAVAGYDKVYKTVDGGTTWTTQDISNGGFFITITFTNASTGYIMGESGILLKTDDGGASWMQMNTGTRNELTSICFTDQNTGYLAGSGGTILKTTNGGGYPYGTDDLKANTASLNIYPNPSRDKITITTTDQPAGGHLSIQDLTGQELLQKNLINASSVIDISTLPAGVYMVKLKKANSVRVTKLIKE